MAANSRFVFVAAAIGLALRLAFGLGYWVDKPLTRDEREYLSLARSLAAGNGFVYDNEVKAERIEPFGRAPGYPVFLALTGGGRDVTTVVPATVKIAQAAAGAAGVLLIAAIAGRLAGPRAAKAAAALAAVYPPLVWISAYAFSEAIAWPLGLVVADVFDRAVARTGPAATRYAIGAGLLAGMAALVRPGLLPFVVIAAAWLLIKRRPVPAGAFLLGAAIVIAPWTARNYAHYGRPVLIATEGGVTFWTGNHALAVGDGDLAGNPRLKLEKDALRARHPELNEEAMEPVYYREALSWIRSHPGDWVQLELRKLFYLIVPVGPSYALHSARYRIASVMPYAVIAPLAVVGFWRLRHRRARTPGLWLLATSAVAVALAFFPQERFRIPVIDPVLIISAASLAGSLARHDT